ncbi:MAG TPA: MarR family transcriptional regulator [Candidatus Acidoferrales bacterium]|jgi:DNA-binding MarR family transcriptional regulator|nr:MarR family transcriptional regulator [Candidatus Acidoferrales bacterium]
MVTRSRRIDYQALAGFRYEIRRFLNFSERAAREAGIEPQQHQALLALKGLPPWLAATVGALAERLQIRHHTAVELSRRLEAKGLLARTRSHSDAREVLLEVTPRGERLLERLSISHRDELSTAGIRLIRALRSVVAHAAHPRATRRNNRTRRTRTPA